MRKISRMIFYSTGIVLCFFYCGVMQEKMFKETYEGNEDFELFTYYVIFICIQCVINYLYSIFLQRTFIFQGENKTSSLYYCACGITFSSAMICSNVSLIWVSYPVQVLGKSCKPLPVMCTSVLFANKSYPLHKYIFICVLILGVILFMNDNKSSINDSHRSWAGEVLLIISLIMDGFTAAIQDRMISDYNTKALHMMASINKWSIVHLFLLVLIIGKIVSFFQFFFEHPEIIWDLVLFSIVNAQGQVFVFMTVEHFGSLFSSVITTTRKVFTIFGSVFFFGHKLKPEQWIGAMLVLFSLLLDVIWKSNYNEIISTIFMYLINKIFWRKKSKYCFNYNGSWV